MNGKNAIIHLGLKVNKIIIQFLIGLFLESGSHEGMRGGSTDKRLDISNIYHYDQLKKRKPMG